MTGGSFYIFFRNLTDLIKAKDYIAPFLGSQDYFGVSNMYPFILMNSIKCEKKLIVASRKEPLFCASLTYLINPHLKKEQKYLERSKKKTKKNP